MRLRRRTRRDETRRDETRRDESGWVRVGSNSPSAAPMLGRGRPCSGRRRSGRRGRRGLPGRSMSRGLRPAPRAAARRGRRSGAAPDKGPWAAFLMEKVEAADAITVHTGCRRGPVAGPLPYEVGLDWHGYQRSARRRDLARCVLRPLPQCRLGSQGTSGQGAVGSHGSPAPARTARLPRTRTARRFPLPLPSWSSPALPPW